DPASGAARATRALCELLARNGWDVRFIATTASELGRSYGAVSLRDIFGIEAVPVVRNGRSALSFEYRGASYRVLDAEGNSINEARVRFAAGIDALVRAESAHRAPDVLITYGSSEAEVSRRAALRKRGTKVVFLLDNLAYHHRRSFMEVDAV